MYRTEIVNNLLKEFKRLEDVCYVDHMGATLYSESQIKAVHEDLLCNVYGNPHSLSTCSRYSTDLVDQVRYRILKHYHANPEDYSVIFTSGATAALKLVAESFHWGERGGSFAYLQDNHTSVLGMREIAANRGASVLCITQQEAFSVFKRARNKETSVEVTKGNSLFVYPAQSNFSGVRYPLSWVDCVHKGYINEATCNDNVVTKWYCLLDAAAMPSLNLSSTSPDFVCVSFYKVFGYPTGLGALLVHNKSSNVLRREYFGGGTVQIALSAERYHVPRSEISERFEDGTLSFLSIMAVRHGFDAALRLIPGGCGGTLATSHSLSLARRAFLHLLHLHHANGAPVTVLYADTDYSSSETQGAVVNFNLLRPSGEYVGFVEVLNMANLHNIQLRTGCFCNPGACQMHLGLTSDDLRNHFQAGHICGDERDLINGQPTGSVRISFGYMSTDCDVDQFLEMVEQVFVHKPAVRKTPEWWKNFVTSYRENFNIFSDFGDGCDVNSDEACITEHILVNSVDVQSKIVQIIQSSNSNLRDRKCETVPDSVITETKCDDKYIYEDIKNNQHSRLPISELKVTSRTAMNGDKSVCSFYYSPTANSVPSNINNSNSPTKSDMCCDTTLVKKLLKEGPSEFLEVDSNFNRTERNQVISSLNSAVESNTLFTYKDIKTDRGHIHKNSVDSPTDSKDPITEFCTVNGSVMELRQFNVGMEAKCFAQSVKRNHIAVATMRHIYVYPIKSCKAMSVLSWKVCARGLEYDREWMVATPEGIALTQKTETQLCRITPTVDLYRKILRLEFPGMESMDIPLEEETDVGSTKQASLCQSKVCGDRVNAIDCGDSVSSWLSEALGRPGLRLLRQRSKDKRHLKGNKDGSELSLSNQAQYLMLNLASVKWFADVLRERAAFSEAGLLDRFRSNFVVEGTHPFEENEWRNICIGSVKFKVDGPCTRCQIICIDQTTGEKTREPLRTLAELFHGKMRFGMYLSQLFPTSGCSGTQSQLSVGDDVTLLPL